MCTYSEAKNASPTLFGKGTKVSACLLVSITKGSAAPNLSF